MLHKSMFYTDKQGRVRYMGKKSVAKSADQLLRAPLRGKKGQFITKDDRVIFIGGPGAGGGGIGASIPQNNLPSFSDFSSITQRELSALEFDSTNDVLRNNAQRINDSSRIDKFFDQHATILNTNTIGYRGSKGLVYPVEVGAKFSDKGYFRFSDNPAIANVFIHKGIDVQILNVLLPKGTRILPGSHEFEGELYLDRGSRFKTVSVNKTSNGGYYDTNGNIVRTYKYDMILELLL